MDFNCDGYELKFIQKQKIKDGSSHLFSYIYTFYSAFTKYKYVLKADFHEKCFFAIKFYPKRYRSSEKKFSVITNKGDVANILVSCLKVIPVLLSKYPTASFGIAASRSYDTQSKKYEPLENNQRFKLYSSIARKKIGDQTFQHYEYPEISGYLLINRAANNEVDNHELQIKQMLINTYNDLPMV